MLKCMRNRGAGREEFEILSGLRHENVIRYLASELFEFERCQFFGIFMPFYSKGDMESYIEGEIQVSSASHVNFDTQTASYLLT